MLHVIGITRFSLATESTLHHFGATRGLSYGEALRRVFDPQRLSRRMALFRAFPLPSMVAQLPVEDVRFTYVVVTSADLPMEWKVRLQDSLAPLDACILQLGRNDDFFRSARKAVGKMAVSRDIFTFRLDDDDALVPGYLRLVARTAQTPGTVLSFDRGLMVWRENGDFKVAERPWRFGSAGLGYRIRRPLWRLRTKTPTIYTLGVHSRVGDRAPVSHLEDISWLRTIHSSNDSGPRKPEASEDRRSVELLWRLFPHLDPRAVAAALDPN